MTDDAIEVITTGELQDSLGSRYRNDDLTFMVAMTNAVVCEAWSLPVHPAPATVKALALVVAERRYDNPKGLNSWTFSVDDGSRTERIDRAQRAGIYVTDQERLQLNGDVATGRRRRYGTLRTRLGY